MLSSYSATIVFFGLNPASSEALETEQRFTPEWTLPNCGECSPRLAGSALITAPMEFVNGWIGSYLV